MVKISKVKEEIEDGKTVNKLVYKEMPMIYIGESNMLISLFRCRHYKFKDYLLLISENKEEKSYYVTLFDPRKNKFLKRIKFKTRNINDLTSIFFMGDDKLCYFNYFEVCLEEIDLKTLYM